MEEKIKTNNPVWIAIEFRLTLKLWHIFDTGLRWLRRFCRCMREVRMDSAGSKCWVALCGWLASVTIGQIMRAPYCLVGDNVWWCRDICINKTTKKRADKCPLGHRGWAHYSIFKSQLRDLFQHQVLNLRAFCVEICFGRLPTIRHRPNITRRRKND